MLEHVVLFTFCEFKSKSSLNESMSSEMLSCFCSVMSILLE